MASGEEGCAAVTILYNSSILQTDNFANTKRQQMRILKLQVQMSVDGFIAGPKGEMDWMAFNWDDKIKSYIMALTEPVDTIILGKNLAQGFIPHWEATKANPQTTDAFSAKMVDTPKVVFSKTLKKSEWANTVVAGGELVKEVNALKNQPGGDIIVYGGSAFVSSLIGAGLIDELNLFVNPAILSEGMPIFRELGRRQALVMKDAVKFDFGIVALKYALG
jgi:dihydrofolate reductase